jgi:hypothetical protein
VYRQVPPGAIVVRGELLRITETGSRRGDGCHGEGDEVL